MTTEQLGQIRQGAFIKARAADLCIILKLQAEEVTAFEKDFVTEGSEVYNAYKEGLIMYKFKVRSEVAKKAMTGDLKAIEQMKEFDREDKIANKR